MIVDPVQAFASATSGLVASSSVAPIPTVVPSLPEYEKATDTGNRTLWYVNTEELQRGRVELEASSTMDGHSLCHELPSFGKAMVHNDESCLLAIHSHCPPSDDTN